MIKWFKTRGYNDRLYFMNLIFAWVFTMLCILITVLQNVLQISDFSIISYGMPVVWTELGVHTGYIIWKAKSENMSKFGNKENIQM